MKTQSLKSNRIFTFTVLTLTFSFFLAVSSCGGFDSKYNDGDKMPVLEVKCGTEEKQNVPVNKKGNTSWDIKVDKAEGTQSCPLVFRYLPFAADVVTGWKDGNLGDLYENVSAVRCTCGVIGEMKEGSCKFVMTLVKAK